MDVLETLAVALGFATLAGLNLYLTVFITGIAISEGWVNVAAKYPELAVLGEPAIIIAAGIFFALEFFSDKIPWVDSLWDSVHTLIRPVGGGLLALHTLGPTEPAFEVIIALLAGGTTLVSHGFKSGTRLAVNASPEPFTNIAASIGEDVAVIGGLALMYANPLVFGVVCLAFLTVALYLTPKLFRRIKAFFYLLFHKVGSPFGDKDNLRLYSQLSSDEDLALSDAIDSEKPDVSWAARVLVGKAKGIRKLVNCSFGSLICLNDEASGSKKLHFVGKKNFRSYHCEIPLEKLEIVQEPRFLSENVVLFSRETKQKLIFRLHAGHRVLAERVVEGILEMKGGELKEDLPQIEEKSENSEKNAEISNKDTKSSVLETESV